MITVAGGCSFVWGSELADSPHGGPNGFSRSTFAALLAGPGYVCAAYPGIGNREISARVRNSLLDRAVDAVVVCWTWPSRDGKIDSDQEILDLQHYLDSRDIPYLFTCADNCIRTDNKRIKWHDWFWFPPGDHHGSTREPRGFYQWARENKYLVGQEHHPLEQAHRDAYSMMQGTFNELVKKTDQSHTD